MSTEVLSHSLSAQIRRQAGPRDRWVLKGLFVGIFAKLLSPSKLHKVPEGSGLTALSPKPNGVDLG